MTYSLSCCDPGSRTLVRAVSDKRNATLHSESQQQLLRFKSSSLQVNTGISLQP
ncbi:hypothetical protein BN2537_16803 [Streptomyces venezuelae]|nr:hypothetical protein BN2537_16803 [Streptomyces venezuelae]